MHEFLFSFYFLAQLPSLDIGENMRRDSSRWRQVFRKIVNVNTAIEGSAGRGGNWRAYLGRQKSL